MKVSKWLLAGLGVCGYLVYRAVTSSAASATMEAQPVPPPPTTTTGKSLVPRLIVSPLVNVVPAPTIPPVPATGCPQGKAPGWTYDDAHKAWVQTCR